MKYECLAAVLTLHRPQTAVAFRHLVFVLCQKECNIWITQIHIHILRASHFFQRENLIASQFIALDNQKCAIGFVICYAESITYVTAIKFNTTFCPLYPHFATRYTLLKMVVPIKQNKIRCIVCINIPTQYICCFETDI